MINPLLDGGAEINPFTNCISTKRKLLNVWMLIKMNSLLVLNGNTDEHEKCASASSYPVSSVSRRHQTVCLKWLK